MTRRFDRQFKFICHRLPAVPGFECVIKTAAAWTVVTPREHSSDGQAGGAWLQLLGCHWLSSCLEEGLVQRPTEGSITGI